jgi:hypothetical protein
MINSTEQLLSECFDYAGIFPPAQISLDEALKNYVRLKRSSDKWIFSRFVIPHHLVPKLAHFADRRDGNEGPLSLCIAGPEVKTLHDFKNTILNIEKDILSVHSDFPGEARTNILELMLPQTSVENLNPEEMVKALEAVVSTSANSRLLPHRVYFEISRDNFDIDTAKKVIKVIAVHNKSILKRKIDNYLFSGFKINCGDAEKGLVPDARYLAEIMLYARDANVAVKFGGNVRHAYPKYDYELDTQEHGVLNLLLAGILAYTQDLNTEETIQVLEEKNAANFIFKEKYMAWRELAAPITELKMLRMLSINTFNIKRTDDVLQSLKSQSIL